MATVLRKLGLTRIFAMLLLLGIAFAATAPANAQLYSKDISPRSGKDRDGDTATEMLNVPGTQIINTRDLTTGETGLHVVTARRDALWIRFLLQRGAPNIRDRNGVTPIQLAMRLGFVEGVEELIKKGAQVCRMAKAKRR